MNDIIIHGNYNGTITAKKITINRNEDTGNTLTLTYVTSEEQALSTLPATGSKTSILAGVILDKIDISYGEAGIAEITLEYVTDVTDSEDYDDDEGVLVEQTLEGSVVDEPLMTSPLCANLRKDLLSYFKAMQDGASMWDMVKVLDISGLPEKEGDEYIEKPLGEILDEFGMSSTEEKIFKLIQKGVQSFRSPNATWTEQRTVKATTTGGKPTVSVSDVGTIQTPSDAPTMAGRNWLLVGKSMSNNGDGTWSVDSTYELSGPGGWDEDLYS